MTIQPSVHVSMLGTFRVAVDGVQVAPSAWRSQKARTMFKYLVAERGSKVPRDTLLDLLWPGEAPDAAMGRLYTTLHFLRRALEPDLTRYAPSSVVHTASGLYWCDPGPHITVDSEVFEELYNEALAAEPAPVQEALPLWEQVIRVYEGNFLAEDLDADWAVVTREALLDKFVDASLRAARLHYELTGDPDGAIQFCHNALHHDRFREELYQALIIYLLAADKPGEAAIQYRNLHTALRDEFALEPSAATEALLRKRGIDALHGLTDRPAAMSKVVRRLPEADATPPGPEAEGGKPLVVDAETFHVLKMWNERLSARYLTSFTVLTARPAPAAEKDNGGGAQERADNDGRIQERADNDGRIQERADNDDQAQKSGDGNGRALDGVNGSAKRGGFGTPSWAEHLGRQLRSSDVVAWDGEQLLVLLPYMERRGAQVVARRLRRVIQDGTNTTVEVDVHVHRGRRLARAGRG